MTTTDEGAIRTGADQRPDARHDSRLDWFRDARFGMFIHWGLYAIPAGEWQGQHLAGIGEWIMLRARIPVAEYERLADRFNPGQSTWSSRPNTTMASRCSSPTSATTPSSRPRRSSATPCRSSRQPASDTV